MRKDIKERIEKIKKGEVPVGYKKGREGIYPEEWRSKLLKLWVKLCERPVELEDDKEYELVTVRRNYGGVDSRGVLKGKDILVKNYFEVRSGDFLISKRQIAHGACGIVPSVLDHAVVSNEYNVFTAQEGTNIEMFSLMMQLPQYKRLFFLMSDGVHIEKLLFKTNHWLKRKLAMPTYEEQVKIAKVLMQYDNYIKLQTNLILEEKKQKKWLMQKLLSGKKRLPGFDLEWQTKKLSYFFSERSEAKAINCELLSITGSGIIPRSEIEGKDNSSEDKSKYKKIYVGDIGYNTMRMWQGVSAYSQHEGIVSPAYTILKTKDNADAKFFTYLFKAPSIIFLFYRYSQGLVDDTRNLKFENFKKIKVNVPSDIEEQKAISQILSQADKEIELIEQQLEQIILEKKAMMQLILTGIVRAN